MDEPKLTAAEARQKAKAATEHVMYLRVLLGKAMRDEAEAMTVARELEAAEGRGS